MIRQPFRASLLATAALLLFSSLSNAENFKKNNITVESPVVQGSLSVYNRANGYVVIHNGGSTDEHLISVESPVSKRIEIQEPMTGYGKTYMHKATEPLTIKPNDYLELKPGSYQIVFFNLRDNLREGEKVPAKLHFEKAGDIDVNFEIEFPSDQSKTN